MGASSFSGDSGWILVYSGGILGILVDSGESQGGFWGILWILVDSEGPKGILWDSWDSGGFWEFSGDSGGFWGFWLILGNGNLGDSGDYGGA